MRQKKWRGTALFVSILAVMGLTIGLRLYGSDVRAATTAIATSAPQPGAASAPSPSATVVPPPSTPAAAAPVTAPSTKSVDGAVEQTPYGPVQVSVTFTGKKITTVKELQAPNDRNRSVEINSNAEPILTQEVLKSQSAHIDTVSGATYTSEGYAQSVQSAIDRL